MMYSSYYHQLPKHFTNMNLAPNSTTAEPELPNNSDSAIITTLLRSLVDKVESGKIHQCQYCPKSFKKKNDLKRHVDARQNCLS